MSGNMTLGVRQRNPGNLRPTSVLWQGEIKATGANPNYCVFEDATYGIRAIAEVMLTYRNVHKLNTLRGIISRWAPPLDDNPTDAYVRAMVDYVGCGPDAMIDVTNPTTMQAVVRGIIREENAGYVYPDDVLNQGLALAGINVVGSPPAS